MKKFIKIRKKINWKIIWQLTIYATLTYLAYNQYKFLGIETLHHVILQNDIRSVEQKVENVCRPRLF